MLEVCVLQKKAFALRAAKRDILPVFATPDAELKAPLLPTPLVRQMARWLENLSSKPSNQLSIIIRCIALISLVPRAA